MSSLSVSWDKAVVQVESERYRKGGRVSRCIDHPVKLTGLSDVFPGLGEIECKPVKAICQSKDSDSTVKHSDRGGKGGECKEK